MINCISVIAIGTCNFWKGPVDPQPFWLCVATHCPNKGRTAGGLKVKLAQQAAAAAVCTTCGSPPDDVSDPEVDNEELLVSSRSTSTTPTPWSDSPPPSSSTSKVGSKGPQVKSSSFKTALSALGKHAKESKDLQGWVELILAEAKKTSPDKHMWGGWLATMVPKLPWWCNEGLLSLINRAGHVRFRKVWTDIAASATPSAAAASPQMF